MGPGTMGPYIRGYHTEAVNDLIVSLRRAGAKQKVHRAFLENVPEYVAQSAELDELADALGIARDEAAGGDKFKGTHLKNLMARGVELLDNNADHIIRVARHRNDPSILLDASYDLKPDTVTVKEKINVLNLVPELALKHVPNTIGAISVIMKLAVPKAITEVQMTETPDVEDSWKGVGEGIFSKSRIEITGLQPAKTVFVRVRYHSNGGVGRWSPVVSIIVL